MDTMENKFVAPVGEIQRRLLGIGSLTPWVHHNSASRLQMYGSHIGQKLVVEGMTERYCQTGMEQEYGKYTFSVKFPCDALILAIIPKYRPSMGADSIQVNPSTVVIFENVETKEIDYLELIGYASYHSHFGFPYKEQPAMQKLNVGAYMEKGTRLLDSPGVTEHGNYMYGVQLNVAFMSHPAVSEDGIMISESALKKFRFKSYEKIVVQWGKKAYPLNLYGNEKHYKGFPDIGDYVRPDRLLMALRQYNMPLSVVRQNINQSTIVNELFDKRVYAENTGGRIIDIRVDTNPSNRSMDSPVNAQLDKYIAETKRYHKEILSWYKRLVKQKGEGLQITPNFNQLVVESLAVTEEEKGNISKFYRKAALDDFRVEFTIEYTITPRIGFKFTSLDG